MYHAKLVVLGIEIEFDADDQKSFMRQAALWQALPTRCPIDDTPTRFYYKSPEGNDYFEVANTGPHLFEYPLGQYREGGELFAKNQWKHWDPDRKEEVVLWEYGRLTPAGQRYRTALLGQTTTDAAPDNPFIDSDAGVAASSQRPAFQRLQAEGAKTFNGQWGKAQAWLIQRYTTKATPSDIRTSAHDLTDVELTAITNTLIEKRAHYQQEWKLAKPS